MKLTITGLFLFIFWNNGFPQGNDVMPLTIGDRVPEVKASLVHYSSKKGMLSQLHKDKYLILDFWSTSCSNCIISFPKMDALQFKYRDKLKVLLVNSKKSKDTENRIENMYKKYKERNGKELSLSTISSDTYLSALFPHNLMPHYIWINPDGIIQAITGSNELTDENVQAFINGALPELPLKMDIDKERPFFAGEYFPEKQMKYYSVFFKGNISGLNNGTKPRMQGSIQYGISMYNLPLHSMYSTVANEIVKGFNKKRMILEVTDSAKLFKEKSVLDKIAWGKEYFYTLDMIVPVTESANLYRHVLDLLNSSTEYYGSIEKRKLPCLVIRRAGSMDKLITKGGETINKHTEGRTQIVNTPYAAFISMLNQLDGVNSLFIDETGYTGNIDIMFTVTTDLAVLKKELLSYGLELQQEEREMEIFVLKEERAINGNEVTHAGQ